MYILGIESSSSVASVCITKDGVPVAEYTTNISKNHSATLLLMVEEVFKSTQLKVSDMDHIAVSTGPGSFTGLRIGIATVKGLAFAHDIKTVAVSSLEAIAMNVPVEDVFICPLMDAKRERAFCGIYEYAAGKMQPVLKDTVMEYDALVEHLEKYEKKVMFLGDAVDIIKEKVSGEKFMFAPEHIRMPRAAGVAAAALSKIEAGEVSSSAGLLPEYLSESQAERNRFRRMKPEDAEAVARIEKDSIPHPWSEKSFKESLENPDAFFAVCESGGSVKGYAGMYISGPEAEITNVAVDKDFRHGGIGHGIVKYLIDEGEKIGVDTFFLEVRKSNEAAIGLYGKIGFKAVGERKDFYSDPKEDGIVMQYLKEQ